MDVKEDRIFALRGDGCVHALRHPDGRFLMKAHSWTQEFSPRGLEWFRSHDPWSREYAAALVLIDVGWRLSIPTFGTPHGAGLWG